MLSLRDLRPDRGSPLEGPIFFYFVQPLQRPAGLAGPVADIRCKKSVTGPIRILFEGAQEVFLIHQASAPIHCALRKKSA
jgi:hypothetical protein